MSNFGCCAVRRDKVHLKLIREGGEGGNQTPGLRKSWRKEVIQLVEDLRDPSLRSCWETG